LNWIELYKKKKEREKEKEKGSEREKEKECKVILYILYNVCYIDSISL